MGSQLAVARFATQCSPGGQSTVAQGLGSGTHAHTAGDESHFVPAGHGVCPLQTQMPLQSDPPCVGSQVSLGSSIQTAGFGQGTLPRPPQTRRGPHSPWCTMFTPWLAATHAFGYVRSSHPQTGAKMRVQAVGRVAQVPSPFHAALSSGRPSTGSLPRTHCEQRVVTATCMPPLDSRLRLTAASQRGLPSTCRSQSFIHDGATTPAPGPVPGPVPGHERRATSNVRGAPTSDGRARSRLPAPAERLGQQMRHEIDTAGGRHGEGLRGSAPRANDTARRSPRMQETLVIDGVLRHFP